MSPKSAAQTLPVTAPAEDAFYIAATQSVSRPRRSLKSNDTFIVLDTHGDMGAATGGTDGLFSPRHALSLSSRTSDQRRAAAAARLQFARRQRCARRRSDQSGLLRRSARHPGEGHCCIFCARSSCGATRPISGSACAITAIARSTFSCRFCSTTTLPTCSKCAARAATRRGTATAQLRGSDQVLLNYHGLDDKLRRTTLTFDPPPNRLATNGALYELQLAPGELRPIFLAVGLQHGTRAGPLPFLRGCIAARRELRAATRGRTTVETSNELFNEMLCRVRRRSRHADDRYAARALSLCRHPLVLDDLRPRRPDHGAADAVVDPGVARGVLRRLAALSGARPPIRSPTPSRARSCTRCAAAKWRRCGEVPFGLYYGSVDSTPLFVLLAGLYAERTGDVETLARAVAGDRGGARLDRRPGRSRRRRLRRILPRRPSRASPIRAGRIRTTRSSMPTADWPKAPIALAEVQGYVYAAKRMAARCARRLGRRPRRATSSSRSRRALRERFEAAFWCPEIGTYALALDGDEAAVPRAHLECRPGAVHRHRAARPRRAASPTGCCSRDFFSGWGIRTVARGEARYNPMSYHNGSIWPHDNALIALGLRALRAQAAGRRSRSRACSTPRPTWTCGGCRSCSAASSASAAAGRRSIRSPARRRPGPAPTPFTLLEASLGLEFDPATHEIRLRNPRLPPFLDEVTLRNLQLGGSSVDLRVRRHGDDVSLDMPRISGGDPGLHRLFAESPPALEHMRPRARAFQPSGVSDAGGRHAG